MNFKLPQQPAEQQVPDQGCVHPGQPTARNSVQNGEILVIPTSNDVDVFVPQKIINQIWNLEYVDLAQLLYKNILFQKLINRKKCSVLMKMETF